VKGVRASKFKKARDPGLTNPPLRSACWLGGGGPAEAAGGKSARASAHRITRGLCDAADGSRRLRSRGRVERKARPRQALRPSAALASLNMAITMLTSRPRPRLAWLPVPAGQPPLRSCQEPGRTRSDRVRPGDTLLRELGHVLRFFGFKRGNSSTAMATRRRATRTR